ncbi:MAG TPA: hypothetical protein VIF60_08650 [Burkholderiaceae bacterium]|jgi:hypothetical protein
MEGIRTTSPIPVGPSRETEPTTREPTSVGKTAPVPKRGEAAGLHASGSGPKRKNLLNILSRSGAGKGDRKNDSKKTPGQSSQESDEESVRANSAPQDPSRQDGNNVRTPISAAESKGVSANGEPVDPTASDRKSKRRSIFPSVFSPSKTSDRMKENDVQSGRDGRSTLRKRLGTEEVRDSASGSGSASNIQQIPFESYSESQARLSGATRLPANLNAPQSRSFEYGGDDGPYDATEFESRRPPPLRVKTTGPYTPPSVMNGSKLRAYNASGGDGAFGTSGHRHQQAPVAVDDEEPVSPIDSSSHDLSFDQDENRYRPIGVGSSAPQRRGPTQPFDAARQPPRIDETDDEDDDRPESNIGLTRKQSSALKNFTSEDLDGLTSKQTEILSNFTPKQLENLKPEQLRRLERVPSDQIKALKAFSPGEIADLSEDERKKIMDFTPAQREALSSFPPEELAKLTPKQKKALTELVEKGNQEIQDALDANPDHANRPLNDPNNPIKAQIDDMRSRYAQQMAVMGAQSELQQVYQIYTQHLELMSQTLGIMGKLLQTALHNALNSIG